MVLPGPSKKVLTVGCAVLLVTVAAAAQTSATAATIPTPATSPASSKPSGKTSAHKKTRKSKRSHTANWRKHGQQKIDAQRTREIQDALIREHYLQGESSGVWNDATEKAMQRYQAENGWQSKTTPDARALIKLGLGPDQQHLLNPESAMTGAASRSQVERSTTSNAPSTSSVSATPASTAPPVHSGNEPHAGAEADPPPVKQPKN